MSRDPVSTRLNLHTINDGDLRNIIQLCHCVGLHCYAWYTSTTLEIPVFEAVVADLDRRTLFPLRASGSGCHPSKKVALCRAITEALQSRLTFISGSRDDMGWNLYKNRLPIAAASNASWLEELALEEGLVEYDSLPDYCGVLEIDFMLKWIVDQLSIAGLPEPIIIDLSRKEVGIPVVYVCVPGLENKISVEGYLPGERMAAFVDSLARPS